MKTKQLTIFTFAIATTLFVNCFSMNKGTNPFGFNEKKIKKVVRDKMEKVNKKVEAAEKQKKGNFSKYKLSDEILNKFDNRIRPRRNRSTFKGRKLSPGAPPPTPLALDKNIKYKKNEYIKTPKKPEKNGKWIVTDLDFYPFEVCEENIIKHNKNDEKTYEH